MILLIDNYDSFTFNLKRYLVQLGQEVHVERNDSIALQHDLTQNFSALVLSPGPKTPPAAGRCIELVQEYSGRLPILGVCLGHQVIYEAMGGIVGRASHPTHGRGSPMQLLPSRLFDGIETGTIFARYHSLVGLPDSLPNSLKVIAWSAEGEIMAVEHKQHSTFGVQFHPESILSLSGHRLLQNFLLATGHTPVNLIPVGDLLHQEQIHAPFQEPIDEDQAVALPSQAMRGV